jgi:hypothetical protein
VFAQRNYWHRNSFLNLKKHQTHIELDAMW